MRVLQRVSLVPDLFWLPSWYQSFLYKPFCKDAIFHMWHNQRDCRIHRTDDPHTELRKPLFSIKYLASGILQQKTDKGSPFHWRKQIFFKTFKPEAAESQGGKQPLIGRKGDEKFYKNSACGQICLHSGLGNRNLNMGYYTHWRGCGRGVGMAMLGFQIVSMQKTQSNTNGSWDLGSVRLKLLAWKQQLEFKYSPKRICKNLGETLLLFSRIGNCYDNFHNGIATITSGFYPKLSNVQRTKKMASYGDLGLQG